MILSNRLQTPFPRVRCANRSRLRDNSFNSHYDETT